MKELSDKKFDELLKQKAESADFYFDESAWDKMEQKLRRRDRVIFIRNSSFVLMLFLLFGGAYWYLNNDSLGDSNTQTTQKTKHLKPESGDGVSDTENSKSAEHAETSGNTIAVTTIAPEKLTRKTAPIGTMGQKRLSIHKNNVGEPSDRVLNSSEFVSHRQLDHLSSSDADFLIPDKDLIITSISLINDTSKSDAGTDVKKSSKHKKLSFSVTALAGPDFSSIESIAGRKGDLTVGLLLNTGIAKNITLSSGIKYGLKRYAASAYDYKLKNPLRADKISGIDASCNVLEIPLQISYSLFQHHNNRVQISSGLSSYLMLKEEYNFKYTPQSGYKDYLLVKNNANQHYLSVLSLAASYHINPKSSHIQWAIEPYLKLPLGGVGEGNVRLKSSGISLNLTYDVTKKNK